MDDEFVAGEVAVFEMNFTRDGEAADPTTVLLRVENPGADPGEVDTEHPGEGSFRAEHPLPVGGTYRWRLVSTGDVQAADQGHFYVRHPLIT